MSAPIVACTLADSLSPIFEEIERSMGAPTHLSRSVMSDGRVVFVCYVHDHGQAFQGFGNTPSRALMNANSDRQTYVVKAEREAS